MKSAAALAAAVLALSGSVAVGQSIQRLTPNYLVVEHGRTIRIGSYTAVDPDCRSTGRPSVSLVVGPQGGQVQIENGLDYPNFAQNNVRFQCDKHKVPAVTVYYQAAPNFTGTDSFTLEAVFPQGVANQIRYTINVR